VWGSGFRGASCVSLSLIHAARRKHGLPLVADDKGKAAKKKNLQVLFHVDVAFTKVHL
jgi:hypothetical protein